MAKIKLNGGKSKYAFVKELGGAPDRQSPSKTAIVLREKGLIRGKVLDYGCGLGFDADQFGWQGYDPHYRQTYPSTKFDTIVCNHVANVLTRDSRVKLYTAIDNLLQDSGRAYITVARNIPKRGKAGVRKRIQNYVVLALPSVYLDEEIEIYEMGKDAVFKDKTREFEDN